MWTDNTSHYVLILRTLCKERVRTILSHSLISKAHKGVLYRISQSRGLHPILASLGFVDFKKIKYQ